VPKFPAPKKYNNISPKTPQRNPNFHSLRADKNMMNVDEFFTFTTQTKKGELT